MRTENLGRVNERVQETIEGLKSTVHCAMEGFKQLQETVDGAKSAVDEMLESVKGTVDEMVQHVKPTADLLDYGQSCAGFKSAFAEVQQERLVRRDTALHSAFADYDAPL